MDGRPAPTAANGFAPLFELTHLGLPTEQPAVAAARAPLQVPFWPGGCDPHADDAYDLA